MNSKTYSLITGLLFLLIAVGHLLRIVYGVHVSLGDHVIPIWVSWIGFVIAAFLAFFGLRLSAKS